VSDDSDKDEAEEAKGEGGKGSEAGGEGESEDRVDLPTWNRSRRKRRANVKAEEQEDAFQRGVRKAGKRAIGKPQLTMIAIALTVLGVAIFTYVHDPEKTEASAATRVLSKATAAESRGQIFDITQLDLKRDPPNPVFDTEESREKAIAEALDELAELGEGDVGLLGELVAGAKALREGDSEAATKHYNAFLAGAPDDHPLRYLGVEGHAFALEASGDLEGALADHQKIAPNEGDFYRDMALWNQGRVLEALGRKDEAVEVYRQYVSEFPEDATLARGNIRDRLSELDPAALEGLKDENALEVFDGAAGIGLP
jgi:tetratricopeptide (TPR) repeat protein